MRPFTLLLAILILTGCGYSQSGSREAASGYQWTPLYREDVKTVAVPIFVNRDFRRGVEFDLTKALVNQIEANSPYKVVPRERADTILEGEIVSVQVDTVSNESELAIPQEQLYVVTVNFVWKDLRSGRILVERQNFQQTTAFYPTLGEGQFVGRMTAAERLATGIMQELQADW